MPNPSLSSFINPTNYNIESVNTQTIAAFFGGGTAGYRYQAPVFSGVSGAASNDPGGLFGWLLYARSPAVLATPTGTTADTYIEYTAPAQLVGDLNNLGGITACLVSTQAQGGTYGFFLNTSGTITPKSAGYDFLQALDYLAYGGTLVIAGTTAGFDDYETNTSSTIDVLMGNTANASLCSWLNTKTYTFGVFPTVADSTGQIGAGVTMPNYTSYVGSAAATTGSTFSSRVFTIYGYKSFYNIFTDLLVSGSKITYSLPVVSDIAGFITRAKNKNTLYSTIAGLSNGTLLNGTFVKGVQWADTALKTSLINSRVNYFINYSPKFLGQDVVGATANSGAILITERFGPSELQLGIQKNVYNITLKYLFGLNNATTRSNIVSDVNSYLNSLSAFIDPTGTQVICDASNGNVDNTSTIYVTVVVKPIASTSSITVTVTATATA